jgi:hypothetical protein
VVAVIAQDRTFALLVGDADERGLSFEGFLHCLSLGLAGGGNFLLFWKDAWLHGQALANLVPDLVAAVPKHQQSSRLVASALPGNAWVSDITSALTVQVMVHFLQLHHLLEDIVL